jgi:hypothetical protein
MILCTNIPKVGLYFKLMLKFLVLSVNISVYPKLEFLSDNYYSQSLKSCGSWNKIAIGKRGHCKMNCQGAIFVKKVA